MNRLYLFITSETFCAATTRNRQQERPAPCSLAPGPPRRGRTRECCSHATVEHACYGNEMVGTCLSRVCESLKRITQTDHGGGAVDSRLTN